VAQPMLAREDAQPMRVRGAGVGARAHGAVIAVEGRVHLHIPGGRRRVHFLQAPWWAPPPGAADIREEQRTEGQATSAGLAWCYPYPWGSTEGQAWCYPRSVCESRW
jgi:hypothetical protein